jgi:hypothetical protein
MASYWLILELAERVFFEEMIKSAGKLTVHAVGNLGPEISTQRGIGLSSLMFEFRMSQESIISCLKRH